LSWLRTSVAEGRGPVSVKPVGPVGLVAEM